MDVEWDEQTFCTISIVLSSLNLLILFLLVIVFLTGSTFHLNLKLISLNLIAAFSCIAVSNFISSVIHLSFMTSEEEAAYLGEESILVAVSNYGVNLVPLTFITILIERALATLYSRVYENLQSCALPSTLIVLSGLIALYLTNNSLHHIDFYSDIELSQRFQVTENIRAIYVLMPLIFVGVLFSFSGAIAGVIQTFISSSSVQLRRPINHLMMNLYITFAFIIVLRQDQSMRKRFFDLVIPWRTRHDQLTAVVEPARVRNAFGHKIVNQYTTESHFKTLNWMWNK
ncbi:sre G protein-coupled chemoreceptor domain-containing protein [Ditylenchus destructor]|nr:sre G protein-coupled chemoreceptor domain-containing protein [Ditylenchus destructor]